MGIAARFTRVSRSGTATDLGAIEERIEQGSNCGYAGCKDPHILLETARVLALCCDSDLTSLTYTAQIRTSTVPQVISSLARLSIKTMRAMEHPEASKPRLMRPQSPTLVRREILTFRRIRTGNPEQIRSVRIEITGE